MVQGPAAVPALGPAPRLAPVMRPLLPPNPVICLLADYDYPSFSGFPFIGILLFLLFAATTAAAIAWSIRLASGSKTWTSSRLGRGTRGRVKPP